MEFTVDQIVKHQNKYIVKVIGTLSTITLLVQYDKLFQDEIGSETATAAYSTAYGFDSKYVGMKIYRISPTTAKEKLTEHIKKYCDACINND